MHEAFDIERETRGLGDAEGVRGLGCCGGGGGFGFDFGEQGGVGVDAGEEPGEEEGELVGCADEGQ